MRHDLIDISPDMTVNDIVQKYPQTLPVLKSFGIDTNGGGDKALGTVLVRHKLDDAEVLDALRDSVEGIGGGSCCFIPGQ